MLTDVNINKQPVNPLSIPRINGLYLEDGI